MHKTQMTTKAEKDRMNQLSQVPCVVCLLMFNVESPAEVHHILDGNRRKGHEFTISLCFAHHRQGLNTPACVSRHPYKKEFERRYGTEQVLLEETNKIIGCY